MHDILSPLIVVFEWILLRFHDLGLGWGMSIIALTVVVRAALLPLTFKQFRSMQSLAAHAPEMKKLQDRYKGDKERLNQEMMKFYRENKINPFASCLPLLAQLPVFLSLFYMLQDDLRFDICGQTAEPCGPGAASFLFITDLTDKATGVELLVLIVLYVGSQLLSTLLMSTVTDRTQRLIFMALPFVFVIFIINFPAGLLVYWITTNLWTIVQQAIIRKRLGPMRPEGAEPAPGLSELFKQARGDGGAGARAAAPEEPEADGQRAGAEGQARGPAPGAATAEEEAQREAEMTDEAATDRVRELLENVSKALGLGAGVQIEESDEGIRGTLEGDDLGLFIGRHGQTIDAVQHLAFKIANRDAGRDQAVRVTVDAAGYRERREQMLHRQADQAAARAARSGRPVALDAMSATERKVVHEYLKDRDDVETYSEGTEPDRHLVVAPAE